MKSWKPEIERRSCNRLPDEVIKFFHKILTEVENEDKQKLKGLNWKNLSSLKKDIRIYSDTKNKLIEIPSSIEYNTVYFKGYSSKSRNFIINLRHAFAHNYIECEQDGDNKDYVIRIALPFKGKEEIKLACYFSLSSLENVVNTLRLKTNKTKKK